MVKKTYLAIFAILISFSGTLAFASVPDHVDLPDQTDRAAAFQPHIVQTDKLTAVFSPLMTTVNNPDEYTIPESRGSALLHFQSNTGSQWGCSGTLIADNKILTAAHCVADSIGVIEASSGMAYFENVERIGGFTFTGTYSYELVEFVAHPQYDGQYWKGYDVAIVTIDQSAYVDIPRILLDTNDGDTISQNVDVLGYGVSGYGADGKDGSNYPFGYHRAGQNTIDAYADTMYKALLMKPNKDYKRGAVIQSDFDNGLNANDAFQEFFGISHTGLGSSEVGVCSGDSGGSIRNEFGEVTGINSYGTSLTWNTGGTSDVDEYLNCSFGEFIGYTNVPYHADWISSQLGTSGGDPPVEEEGPNCNGKSKNPACL